LLWLSSGLHDVTAEHDDDSVTSDTTTDDHAGKKTCAPGIHSIANLSPLADPIAPDVFRVSWIASAGEKPIVLEAVREWSPLGVDRFYQLVLDNFYDCAAFFRVAPGEFY
jgi:hypothetical protein